MTPAVLDRHEFVVHRFFPAEGDDAESAYADVRRLWSLCKTELRLTSGSSLPGIPATLPADPGRLTRSPLLAVAENASGPISQAVLRRHQQLYCLSVWLSGEPDWAALRERWRRFATPPPTLLGEAVLYIAYLTGDQEASPEPPDPDTESPGVSAALAASAASTLLGPTPAGAVEASASAVHAQATSSGFAICELPAEDDARRSREFVVLAPRAAERPLSRWLWSGDGHRLPPLAQYLSHAAKLRYHLRVWGGGEQSRVLRHRLDGAVRTALEQLPSDAEPVTPSEAARLSENATRLTRLLVDEAGAVVHATRLREMRRSVEAARANLASVMGAEFTEAGPLTPLGDDRDLTGWFQQRLEDESEYLDASLERARQVRALLDQFVHRLVLQREERGRRWQEQVNYGQLAVVAAITVTLAAIQALGYRPPLPGRAEPAVVALLGTVSLSAAASVVRPDPGGRRRHWWWLRPVSAGGVAASAVWLACAATVTLTSASPSAATTTIAGVLARSPVTTAVLAASAFVLVAGLDARRQRHRHRHRLD